MMPPLNNGGVTAWVARAFGARVGECVGLNMLLQLGGKGSPDCLELASSCQKLLIYRVSWDGRVTARYQIVDLATYTTVVTGYAQSGGYEVRHRTKNPDQSQQKRTTAVAVEQACG